MATNEDRLRRLESFIEAADVPTIESETELLRQQSVRAARMFGDTMPIFRTRVALHFDGPAVEVHDLPGSLAGGLIAHFIAAVKAAGASFHHAAPSSLELYLSPSVAPGSTVLELFGAPRPESDTRVGLDEIVDTPVDQALGALFEVLGTVGDDAAPPTSEMEIDGVLGKQLFALSQSLIQGNLDLNVSWETPRGSVTRTDLPRTKARRLRDLLDREHTETTRNEAFGQLVFVSTDQRIGVREAGKKGMVELHADGFTEEDLRALWAKDVTVRWRQETVSHPQRDATKVTRSLESIQPGDVRSGQGELDTD